jgi:hypothetical protein
MSVRQSLLLVAALVGCATAGPGVQDPDVDTEPVDAPGAGDAFAEHAGHDHLEPPPPGDDVIDEEQWTDPPVEDAEDAFLLRQVLVRVGPGTDLGAVAARNGTKAVEAPDGRGYGSIAVPEGVDPQDLLADLLADPDVVDCGRMGLVVGAADGWAVEHQWHHDNMQRMGVDEIPPNLGDITVAILDTGVAYEDYTDPVDGQRYVAAPTLGSTEFVAPWDFVNNDAHANDDHQHGTHLASLIGSQGTVAGAAPGVRIMPVKVLDHRKRGTELTVVRGLYHAVDNGADVVNLSLSFPSGYLPSPLLQRAIQDVSDAGVVMVAAAGNEGVRSVTWPAASPLVFAVGAADGERNKAPYSNWGGMLDVLAPGGDLSADLDGDGLPDGILAETIAVNDPEQLGLWMMEGTSQATALVSAVVAARLAMHPRREDLSRALQDRAGGAFDPDEGLGAGNLLADRTVKWAASSPMPVRDVSLRPFLVDLGGNQLQPGVWVRVTDETGAPVNDEVIYGAFAGSSEAVWVCKTSGDGVCVDGVDVVVADPTADALAWTVVAHGVQSDGDLVSRPGRAVVASDALDVLAAAMDADEVARGSAILFLDDPGMDATVGQRLAGAYVAMDLGSGLMSSPMGVLATPPAVAPWMSKQLVSLDVDGTGLLSSPMAAQTLVVATLFPPSASDVDADGSGLLSSPMLGFRPSLSIYGSSGPLGFDIDALLIPGADPTLDVADPLYDGEVVQLDQGVVLGTTPTGSALEDRLDAGAWQDRGFGAASSIVGSGQLSTALEGSGTRARAVEVTE